MPASPTAGPAQAAAEPAAVAGGPVAGGPVAERRVCSVLFCDALGPGDFFGEMALIDHSYRSATITAETELRCLLFTAWVFRPFALEHPETAWALLETMVQRVREAEAR